MRIRNTILHPNLIIGAISYLLLFIGVVFRASNYLFGNYIILSSFCLGAIHWIWGTLNVCVNYNLDPKSKIFWIIMVLLIPPVGGMLYYMMKRKNVQL